MKHGTTYLLLALTAIFWGANFYFGKLVVQYIDPESANLVRFGLSAIILLVVLQFSEGIKLQAILKYKFTYLILSFIGIFAFNTFLLTAMKYTSAVNGALIAGLNPLLTLILSVFILRARINVIQVISIAVSFSGVVLVVSRGKPEVLLNMDFSVGDLLMLGAAISFALYSVLVKKHLKGSSPLQTTTVMMAISTFFFAFSAFVWGKPYAIIDLPLNAWWAMGFMVLLAGVLAYLFWNRGVEKVGAEKSSLFMNIVPLSGALTSVIMGGTLTHTQVWGGLLIIIGVSLSMLYKPK